MMNTLLSILVCIAMLCSGTGALPAQPESATTWTLRNLSIDLNGESVTLDPEVRITTAAGAEKMQLHFEVLSGEDVLMPVSGEITPEAIRFALGRSEQAYTVTDATLTELMDLNEEDAQAIALVTGLIGDYCALLNRSSTDAEFAREMSNVALQAMIDACGAQAEETEVEVYGEFYPAQMYKLDLDLRSALGMLDELRTCGIDEFEALVEDLAGLCALALGEEMEFTSFAALADEMDGVEVSYPMTLTMMQQDDLAYSFMAYSAAIEGEEFMQMNAEAIAQGEETEVNMILNGDMDGTSVTYNLSMEMTGPYNAPEDVSVDLAMGTVNDSSETYEGDAMDESGESVSHLYESHEETIVHMSMEMWKVDGMDVSDVSVSVNNSYTSSINGEENYSYENTVRLEGDSEDYAEEDGSVTTDVSLSLEVDGETLELSFDLNRTEGAVVDYFAGLTTCEIDAEMDDESLAYGMLSSDAMGFAADAMQLSSDESVIALMELMGMSTVEDGDVDPYDGDSYDYDDYDDYDDDDGESVSSLEEAAGIFAGNIPDFETPEGFVLESVDASEDMLTASYYGDAGGFSLNAFSYASDSTTYYAMNGGALEPAERLAEVTSYDGESIDSVTLYGPEGTLYFYFSLEDASQEAVEAILAGLKG